MKKKQSWPENCVWPEPFWNGLGNYWDLELAEMSELDEDGQDLLEIKEYMDELVACGRLNPDYSLNEDYEDDEELPDYEEDLDYQEEMDEDESFRPEKGIDYWDDGFDVETWEEDLTSHINLLKIDIANPDPISFIREVTGYTFVNENLARQAFTRRAFALEYGVGNSEELEFYGDAILNSIVSREMYKRFSDPNICVVEGPFQSIHSEGELSKIRQKFISRDHLAVRAAQLGLDQFILYGSREESSDSAREDMMEALIGAIAVDSDWNWSLLADVVDRLINLQLDCSRDLIKESYYERMNTWHQKHFGRMPEYSVYRNILPRGREHYDCTLKYCVPDNDKGIWSSQRVDLQGEPTRSEAREKAARQAVNFLRSNGLWINLADAGIVPDVENSINQLQELFQKKYVEEPVYQFEQRDIFDADWYCECTCSGIEGFGTGPSKTKAKKKAAYMVLVCLLKSTGKIPNEWGWEVIS